MRGRRQTSHASNGVLGTALLATLIAGLLASSVAVVCAVRAIDLGPQVGDILVFRPGARMPADWEFTVATTSSANSTCELKPEVMAQAGGSLVVEQRFQKPPLFQVHWAGKHTSNSGSDCGASGEFIVPGSDLQLLSNAVGGPGVEPKIFPEF
jgi:hypothetical protein